MPLVSRVPFSGGDNYHDVPQSATKIRFLEAACQDIPYKP
jgi:hypothetical protein